MMYTSHLVECGVLQSNDEAGWLSSGETQSLHTENPLNMLPLDVVKMVDGNTVTPLHAQKAPLTKEQRIQKQALFLTEFAECGNVKYCCQVAGISRKTFYQWKARDKAFQTLLTDVEPDVDDTLEFAAYERAVKGVETFLVSQGKLVYEEIPVLDANGEQERENGTGRLIYKRGKPIVERKYSDTLLITLLKARIPAKYRDKQQIDLNAQITSLADTAKAELLADLAAAMTNEDQEPSQQN